MNTTRCGNLLCSTILSFNYQFFTISSLFKKCHIIVWTSSICLKYSNCKPSSWTGCILQYCIGVAGTSRRFCAICWTLANLPSSLPPDDCLTQTAHPHFTRMAILYKFAYNQHMIKCSILFVTVYGRVEHQKRN